jgi:hypothetical protein
VTSRQTRLSETFAAVGGPLVRLEQSLQQDGAAIAKRESDKSGHDQLATDAFLQRFQQVTDLTLRKLFPRLLAALENSDVRHPFGAMLDRLDGYEILSDVPWWIELNEIRNRLTHEYAMSDDARAAEIAKAWAAAGRLHAEIIRVRDDRDVRAKVFDQ